MIQRETVDIIELWSSVMTYFVIEHMTKCHDWISWLDLNDPIPWFDLISSIIWFDLTSSIIWSDLIKYYLLILFD